MLRLQRTLPKCLNSSMRRAFSGVASTDAHCFVEHLSGSDEGIAVLRLNRPQSKNAIGKQMLTEMQQVLDHVRFDNKTRVLLVKSDVDGVFCAGADLKERAAMPEQQVAAFVHQLRSTFTHLETLPMPTICSIDGAALGGGLELALCCDIRVAGPKAVLGLPETKLAIIPGAGGTQRLPRIIGIAKAKELIYTARRLNAKEAFSMGLVNRMEDSPTLSSWHCGLAIAREILPQGPIALRMAKLAISRGVQMGMDNGLALEQSCYAQVIPTKDRLEGLSAFREKRTAVYRGH